MNVHKNARLTPHSRAELVRRVLDQGQPAKAVAKAFGVDAKTVAKWGARQIARPPRSPATALIRQHNRCRETAWRSPPSSSPPWSRR